MANRREIAADYLARGWPVVPVTGKLPSIPWKLFQHRLPTDDELDAWPWGAATGIAVVIGPGLWRRNPYLWCLEIEGRNRAEAEPWLDAEIPHWGTAGLVAESGGGGLHVYCEAKAAVASTRHAWGEIRGAGNICVLPPSRHPNGRRYAWLSDVEPVLLEPAGVPGVDAGKRLHFTEASGPVATGARNDTLFKLGCRLRRCGLKGDEIAAALTSVNCARCQPPLEDDEVARIAGSAGRYTPEPTTTFTFRSSDRPVKGLRIREVRRA